MKLLLTLLLTTLLTAQEPYPVGLDQNVFLLSYPYSGSRWLMKNVQYMTREVWHGPSYDHLYFDDLTDTNRLFRGHECNDKYIYYKNFKRFPYSKNKDFLILLLRDYKRHICPYLNGNNTIFHAMKKSPTIHINNYFTHLAFFDKWPSDRKALIYYEDLLSDPLTHLTALSHPFGYTAQDVKNLIDNDSFKIVVPKDKWAHLPKHKLKEVDTYFQNKYPDLFNKYLTRYITK